MDFSTEEIYTLAETIWNSTLGLAIEPDSSGAFGTHPRSTAACIQITGAWNGAVMLDCPAEIARLAASIMFHTEPDRVTLTDVQDAIAELANMFGGNIKGLLPATCYLSLPAVVEGADYSARVPGSRLKNRLSFLCNGHVISIAILERIEPKTAAA